MNNVEASGCLQRRRDDESAPEIGGIEPGHAGDIEDNAVAGIHKLNQSTTDMAPMPDQEQAFNQQMEKFVSVERLLLSPVLDTRPEELTARSNVPSATTTDMENRMSTDTAANIARDRDRCKRDITAQSDDRITELLQSEQRRRVRRRMRHREQQLLLQRAQNHRVTNRSNQPRSFVRSALSATGNRRMASAARRIPSTTRAQESMRMLQQHRHRELRASIFTRNRRELCEHFSNSISLDS